MNTGAGVCGPRGCCLSAAAQASLSDCRARVFKAGWDVLSLCRPQAHLALVAFEARGAETNCPLTLRRQLLRLMRRPFCAQRALLLQRRRHRPVLLMGFGCGSWKLQVQCVLRTVYMRRKIWSRRISEVLASFTLWPCTEEKRHACYALVWEGKKLLAVHPWPGCLRNHFCKATCHHVWLEQAGGVPCSLICKYNLAQVGIEGPKAAFEHESGSLWC